MERVSYSDLQIGQDIYYHGLDDKYVPGTVLSITVTKPKDELQNLYAIKLDSGKVIVTNAGASILPANQYKALLKKKARQQESWKLR